jgi:hypothetical protein
MVSPSDVLSGVRRTPVVCQRTLIADTPELVCESL